MSNECTSILVGIARPVSEILLLSKMANFPFSTMDYSPWSSENLIDWNQLKKFMQVGVNVTCMYTNFGGCSFPIWRPTFKFGQFFLSDLIDWNRLKKFMQVGIDVTPVLVGMASLVSEIWLHFKNGQISPSDRLLDRSVHRYYVCSI